MNRISWNPCVEVESHNLDENDQHSTWKSENLQWVLESIEEKKLKFKRGPGNYTCLPKVGDVFENVDGGIHKDNINITKYYFEKGNPFRYALLIGFHTGLRIGEVYGLTWDDIDFTQKKISINKQTFIKLKWRH